MRYLVFLILALMSDCESNGIVDPPFTQHPTFYEFPRISPDGSQMLYYSHGIIDYSSEPLDWSVNFDSVGIWIYDFESNSKKKLLNANYADWSPDQSWIIYESNGNIFKAKIDERKIIDTSITQLTFSRNTFFPEWSPDNSRIAFLKSVEDSDGERGIWTMTQDGDNLMWQFIGSEPSWNTTSQTLVAATSGKLIFFDISGKQVIKSITVDEKNSFHNPKLSMFKNQIVVQIDGMVTILDYENEDVIELGEGEHPDWGKMGTSVIYSAGPIYIDYLDGSEKEILIDIN